MKLMTIGQFCSEFSVSRSTVYRLQKAGKIDFLKVGRAVRIARSNAIDWVSSLANEDAR